MNCEICNKEIIKQQYTYTSGYAIFKNKKICYDCCADLDKEYMNTHNQITLYYNDNKITNWPGTLQIPILSVSVGKHNIARKQYHIKFKYNNELWYGKVYGDNTQICHCKKYR